MGNERHVNVESTGSSVPARKDQPIMMTACPVADIYESRDAFVVALDLPGSTKETIEVLVKPGYLAVRGMAGSRHESKGTVLHREIGWNRYEREFKIGPGIDEKNVTSHYADGVLTILLPKTEESKPRQITIT